MKKEKIIKLVFILFAIILLALASLIIFKQESKKIYKETEIINDSLNVYNDTLDIGISNFDSYNPLITNNKDIIKLSRLVYEPLISFNQKFEIENCLIKEFSKINNSTYLIRLDSNIVWSDGTKLNANDVKNTIKSIKDNNKNIYRQNVINIKNIEIIDESTFKIQLYKKENFFEYNLTFPIVKEENLLIGTGKYEIKDRKDNEIKLVKKEKWHNKINNSCVDFINVKFYKQMGAVYNAFKNDEINMFFCINNNVENYIGNVGYVKKEHMGREYDYISLNCENKILKLPEIRKVLNFAINKDDIIINIFDCKKYKSNFILDFNSFIYNKEYNNFDLNMAKDILTKNDWKLINNTWQKVINNKIEKLSFNLNVEKDNQERKLVSANIKSQLNEFGINININEISKESYLNILKSKDYEMLFTGKYNSYKPDLSNFLGSNNLANYYNEEINNLLFQVSNINEKNEIKEKYNSIKKIFDEEIPYISLYRNKEMIIMKENISNIIDGNFYSIYLK